MKMFTTSQMFSLVERITQLRESHDLRKIENSYIKPKGIQFNLNIMCIKKVRKVNYEGMLKRFM